jgi:hypothetical protein
MSMPGFTAGESLGITTRSYRGGVGFGRSTLRGGRSIFPALGFICGSRSCACAGVDDCLDLIITTDLCGPSIDCVDVLGVTFCRCTRK